MVQPVIIGTGSFAPDKVLTNFDLEKMVDTSDEWIRTRTGIRERRIVQDGVATSDLATEAARRALEAAGVAAEKIELIIVATVTPDMPFPATACLVQDRLEAKNSAAFDLNAACSGFLYALAVAAQFIRTGSYRYVLVIGAETISKITDWTDRSTCVLFGDGAGAVVVAGGECNGRGILDINLYTDGALHDALYIPAGGSRLPASRETVENRLHYIKMRGNETFKVAVRSLAEATRHILADNGYTVEDVDLFIPHQANKRIIDAVAEMLKLPKEKIYSVIERYGNTSASSIPIALDEAVRGGKIRPGNLLIFSAFGGGLTWGASLIKW